jgi:hypothetical protein
MDSFSVSTQRRESHLYPAAVVVASENLTARERLEKKKEEEKGTGEEERRIENRRRERKGQAVQGKEMGRRPFQPSFLLLPPLLFSSIGPDARKYRV